MCNLRVLTIIQSRPHRTHSPSLSLLKLSVRFWWEKKAINLLEATPTLSPALMVWTCQVLDVFARETAAAFPGSWRFGPVLNTADCQFDTKLWPVLFFCFLTGSIKKWKSSSFDKKSLFGWFLFSLSGFQGKERVKTQKHPRFCE